MLTTLFFCALVAIFFCPLFNLTPLRLLGELLKRAENKAFYLTGKVMTAEFNIIFLRLTNCSRYEAGEALFKLSNVMHDISFNGQFISHTSSGWKNAFNEWRLHAERVKYLKLALASFRSLYPSTHTEEQITALREAKVKAEFESGDLTDLLCLTDPQPEN